MESPVRGFSSLGGETAAELTRARQCEFRSLFVPRIGTVAVQPRNPCIRGGRQHLKTLPQPSERQRQCWGVCHCLGAMKDARSVTSSMLLRGLIEFSH